MSYYIIPLFISLILAFAIKSKIDAYNAFIKGATEGLQIGIKIFPYMLSMMVATQLFLRSGIIDLLLNKETWIPLELIMQGLFRPISGNAAMSVMIDIYNSYGVDSKMGIASSILEGSSDTTMYIITLYFGSVGVVKYRYAIKAGLIADLLGFIFTIIILKILL